MWSCEKTLVKTKDAMSRQDNVSLAWLAGSSPGSSDTGAGSGASQDLDSLAEDLLLEQMLRRDPFRLPEQMEQQVRE